MLYPTLFYSRITNTVQNATRRTEVHVVMFCEDTIERRQ